MAQWQTDGGDAVMATQAHAYDLLLNGTIYSAVRESYEAAIGPMMWPLLFFGTLLLVYLKSDSPANVAIVTIIGNVVLFPLIALQFQLLFYATLSLSIGFTIWAFITKG